MVRKGKVSCYRCGKENHTADQCRFNNSTCHTCHKKGHLAKVCRFKGQGQGRQTGGKVLPTRKSRRKGRNKSVRTEQEDRSSGETGNDEELQLNKLNSGNHHPVGPIIVDVVVNDTKVRMEVDTGASVTIMPENTWKKLFPGQQLQPSSQRLTTYSGEPLTVCGELPVVVKYQNQRCQLTLTVVEGTGSSLLGRDWLTSLRLDWNRIWSIRIGKTLLANWTPC